MTPQYPKDCQHCLKRWTCKRPCMDMYARDFPNRRKQPEEEKKDEKVQAEMDQSAQVHGQVL